ncbi:MAG: hypothetical protein CM15mV149_120 [uncultured marine virus]|nr:MAG: hypothetical protein CM15mV149_120 [uncultured marine virus]
MCLLMIGIFGVGKSDLLKNCFDKVASLFAGMVTIETSKSSDV